MIKEIIFDFDGTIGDTFDISIEILNQIRHDYGFEEITPKLVEDLKGKGFSQIMGEAKISILKLSSIIKRQQKEMNKVIGKVNFFKGMDKLLMELKKENFTLGILTSNSQKNVSDFLAKNKLSYFDYISSGKNLFGKARLLKRILKKRNLNKDEVVYIGDEIRDVEACRKIDLKIIAVAWGFNSKEGLKKAKPNWLVDKPEEILSVLIKK